MGWIIAIIVIVLLFVVWMCKPIRNQYGTFGDDDYDYEQEARDKGWIE